MPDEVIKSDSIVYKMETHSGDTQELLCTLKPDRRGESGVQGSNRADSSIL